MTRKSASYFQLNNFYQQKIPSRFHTTRDFNTFKLSTLLRSIFNL